MKKNKGFTLIELLVVIAIIGIIAVVALPALFKNIEKAKVSSLEADISAIKSAVRSIYTETDLSNYYVTWKKNEDGSIETNMETKDEGDNILPNEIESLKIPFGGSYGLMGNSIGSLSLLIMPETSISEDGIKKLEKDLGQTITDQSGKDYTMLMINIFENE